jgi:hypothetical protein
MIKESLHIKVKLKKMSKSGTISTCQPKLEFGTIIIFQFRCMMVDEVTPGKRDTH